MKIRISADSTCDLAPDTLSAYNIAVTPLYVNLGDRSEKDGIGCAPADIFAYTSKTGKLCTTSAVSVADYEDFFASELENFDAVIHFTISSEMSACWHNACIASERWPGRVFPVDTRSLSSGIGILAIRAAIERDAGLSAAEIYDNAIIRREKICVSMVLDQLDYMVKGGRCSTVAALGANLLKLKPSIECVGGKLVMGKKYRGNLDRVLKDFLRDQFQGRTDILTDLAFAPNSQTKDETVQLVCSQMRLYQNFDSLSAPLVGATVACHCGPDTQGLAYEKK